MRGRLLLLILINVLLVGGLFFVLHKTGVIDFRIGQSKPYKLDDISSDPFLMEKESLRKQWAVLTAKENDLEQRQSEFDKSSQDLQEKLRTLNTQMAELNTKTNEMQESTSMVAQTESSIRSLAQKIINIAPNSGALILNDMDSTISVEVVKMMDKIAEENGTQSTSAYLISLMDPDKRKELVRLLSAYPSTLGNLNVPLPPSADDSAAATE